MNRMIENTRRLLAAGLLVLAASCSTSNTLAPSTPDITNTEVAGFQNVQPGSEEDFILNVGRRTYFTQGSAALDSVAKATLDTQ
ncbi:MAG: OmpA family protein, partial [Mesorhizobium sp.]